MRIALLADPHANLTALDAVYQQIDAAAVDEIWCLGDIVGYGPDPAAVLRRVRQTCALVIAGNHDMAAAELAQSRISAVSDPSLKLAAWELTEEEIQWLGRRSLMEMRSGLGVCHASPRDPLLEFITTLQIASRCLDRNPAPITFYAHTHVARAYVRRYEARTVETHRGMPGTQISLSGVDRALINPGAVGRPQADRYAYAMWGLYDSSQLTFEWMRADYDVAAVQARIRDNGLPEHLAVSLAGHSRPAQRRTPKQY